MDKAVLRSVLKDLVPGQTVSCHLRGSEGPQEFTVVSTKRGRGKHGSLLAILQGAAGEPIEIGTPRNKDVISLTCDGNFYGVLTEREDPPTYHPNEVQATRLKTALSRLTGEAGRGQRVRLDSTVPEFNGTFSVTQGRLEKGKYGQVHLWLTRENAEPTDIPEIELWSYRHSGIITDFEVLSV